MTATFPKLAISELKLVLREPLVLAFVFAFPVVTVLVLIGSFGVHDPAFSGQTPAHWYLSSYLGVVAAAIGLVMMPVHLAAYRERGVLRRFTAAGFAPWSFAGAEVAAGLAITAVAWGVLLLVTGVLYGLPPVQEPLATVAGLAVGAVAMVSIGLLLGSVLPNARSAQGVGLLIFFPAFLLGGGGPPPSQMGSAMRTIANVLPLTHITRSIQGPWLGLGTSGGHLALTAAIAAACMLGWARKVRL
jgi:ABC-2 type transport system permease protein